MKTLNKTQMEIEELAKQVPELTEEQKEWGKKHYSYSLMVADRTKHFLCPDCKTKIPVDASEIGKKGKTFICPHCGARTKVDARRHYEFYTGRGTSNHKEAFFEVRDVVGGWQVTRLIYMQRYCYVKSENTPWEYWEVCQAWNNPDHKKTFFRSFPKKCINPYYQFSPFALWSWGCECVDPDNNTYAWYRNVPNHLEPRKEGGSYYFNTTDVCPNGKILPAYRKMGLTAKALNAFKYKNNMYLYESLSNGNYKPMYETLLKRGEYDAYERLTNSHNREEADAYFTALKICWRNGYDYKRYEGEWYDLVGLLIDLGMDYHNPHYVCPDDFHRMHRLMLTAKRRKEDAEALRKEAMKNKEYKERISQYLDMDIHDDFLHLIVLPDIEAFKEEGDHLGHCVYSCGYYNRKDSLILSARDETGKRWETVEVDLNTFTIKQSYGYGDKHTKRHKEIADLVNGNM